eukprot:GFKZ01012125.1.p1 GENE.GFKZ01012125.1~~GFKZ01012125.1.p1  ORF type:complete len:409 (-),score=61.23 GFKZ01012125.1:1553-2779(-)
MVFILLGAVKGAKAVKKEYEKDKKRNQVITTIEGSPSGPTAWYADPSSSTSSSPPSHNAIGCWSRDTPSEPNPPRSPPLANLPPSQSSIRPDNPRQPPVEQPLPRSNTSNSSNGDRLVERPTEKERRDEKPAQKISSKYVAEGRGEGSKASRVRKPRKVPPAAPLGSFAAACEQQSRLSGDARVGEPSGRGAQVGEHSSGKDNGGIEKRSSVEMKFLEEKNVGVARNERAMSAIARKRNAVVSMGEGIGRKAEGGNERAKAAMARKRGSGIPGTDSAEAKLLEGIQPSMAATTRKRSGNASGAGERGNYAEGVGGASHDHKGRRPRGGATGGAARDKSGSFAEAMRKGPHNSGAGRDGIQQRKESMDGIAHAKEEGKVREADAPRAPNGAVTSMYAQGTMKRRVARRE